MDMRWLSAGSMDGQYGPSMDALQPGQLVAMPVVQKAGSSHRPFKTDS